MGAHAELLAGQGQYAHLHAMQRGLKRMGILTASRCQRAGARFSSGGIGGRRGRRHHPSAGPLSDPDAPFFAIIAWAALARRHSRGGTGPDHPERPQQDHTAAGDRFGQIDSCQRGSTGCQGDLLLQLDDESVKADVKRIEQEQANLRVSRGA